MDVGAKRLLETATIETLHANHFSRASTQATLVLTDLLSRYLTLLSTTCAKYAEHAGRLRLNARDAEHALHELGVDVEELGEYCVTEGREMSRYAVHTARRLEDLNEFRALLSAGLREDQDDAIPLVYGPVPDEALLEPEFSESESEEEEQEEQMETNASLDLKMALDSEPVQEQSVPILEEKRDERMASPRPLTPPLPLSPISNPSTPPRKRLRTAHWQPPPHIPDFLPPFPSNTPRHTPSPPPMALPPPESSMMASMSPLKLERPVTPPPEVSSGAADYRTSIPYSMSSISGQPVWHLPVRPASPPPPQRPYELPITQSALYHAYHHVLTHPPPKDPGPVNPARYKVALDLIDQTENEPHWEPHSSLYAISAPNAPRVAPIGPSYPQTIDSAEEKPSKDKGKEADIDARLPKKPPRSILGTERIAPLISQQTSRIPALALRVLPGPIHTRTTKVNHPPVLSRGNQKLIYGPGVNAHWNSGTGMPGVAPTPQLTNGVKKEKEKEKDAASKALPDAKMYATWNWDQKSYREPLSLANRRTRMGSVQLPNVNGNSRRVSESHG
ncbi:hypothetical protein BDY19DRAFT_954514 [Irpex rosettiformis]|uniref:Uncharacterized protein n=1 Tax=Irpex rosettiformis TaxID=378272 RepID=A0ACB8U0I9_9APHY|nr:hypothetical protein BDY19DRAFT_954514 [Irpex rosettiformis]